MKFLLLFFFTIVSLATIALDIKWGAIQKSMKKEPLPLIFGQNESEIFCVRYLSANKQSIEIFDKQDLRLRHQSVFKANYMGHPLHLITAIMVNNKPFVITNFYHKKKKQLFIFAHQIDSESLIGEPIFLGKTNSKKIINTYYPFVSKSQFQFCISKNTKNVFSVLPGKRGSKAHDVNNAIFFDGNKADTNHRVTEHEKDFQILDTKLSAEGNYYTLGYKPSESKLFSNDKQKLGRLFLKAYNTDNGESNSIEIKDSITISSVKMHLSTEGTIVIIGLISSINGSTIGSNCLRFDNRLNQLSNQINYFDLRFLTPTLNENSDVNEKKPLFTDYFVNHIIESDNGSFTVLAEQYYKMVTSATATDLGGGEATTKHLEFHYNDIIAVNYDQFGKFQWKKLIEKQQYSRNDHGFYNSYVPFKDKNTISLIFNTNQLSIIKNRRGMSKRDMKKAARRLICVKKTIQNDGLIDTEKIFEMNEKDQIQIVLKHSFQDQQTGDVILLAKSKKYQKIGSISVN